MISFVGSRIHSEYGERACKMLIEGLAGYPITIVSGLAIGIDTIAHEHAIKVGLQTIAVLGSGLDRSVIYPKSNVTLANNILESGGALVSELKPFQNPTRNTFPKRNRIMAGLSNMVIAVESDLRSGTRITTRLAIEYGKEVGAVPHSIFSKTSLGTNELINQGAHCIQRSEDILRIIGYEIFDIQKRSKNKLTNYERLIYSNLKFCETRHELFAKTQIPKHIIQSALISLEMKSLIIENAGTITKTNEFHNPYL